MVEFKLSAHEHGKGRVRVVKVRRNGSKHDIWQLEAQVILTTPVEEAYYNGDNSRVLPTDSVKNSVYFLAKKHDFETLEEFAILVAKHFVVKHPQVIFGTKVKMTLLKWDRITVKGQAHNHAFVHNPQETRFTEVHFNKQQQLTVKSGFHGLKIMKTTQSSFEKFFRDELTTLPDVPDRLVGTVVSTSWSYTNPNGVDFDQEYEKVKQDLLEAFAGAADVGVASPAVQYSLHQMGSAVLRQHSQIREITINMPNVHNIPVDLSRFGLRNLHPHGEVFQPQDEPHGIIEATVSRDRNSRL